MRSRTLMIFAVVLGTAGCVTGKYEGNTRSKHDCGSLGGVFLNAGRNAKDGSQGLSASSYTPLLIHVVDKHPGTRPDIEHESKFSVAIRHVGRGKIDWALVDEEGGVVRTGAYEHYATCSKGVLKKTGRQEIGEGWVGTKEKITSILFVNEDGNLVVTTQSTAAGLFLGFPIVGTDAHWKEFSPHPRFDLADIDF